ncbi:NUDIX hydrolase N-terminal domain-containing protein [Mammaliicoccus lentus]
MDSKQFFQKLLAISNSGINYSKDPYDVERFNEIFDITQEFINSQSNNKNLTLE